jgi:TRAP-type uncharacterized transport system substrate-binding protein
MWVDGLGLSRRERLWVALVIVLAVSAIGALVAAFWRPAPPARVVMSTGPGDGAYHSWALRYRDILAREGVELVLQPSAGAVENLQRLRSGLDGVTLALVQGGLADEADRQGLVSLGAVAHEPLWIFHRQGLRVEGFWSFASTRIAGGPPGSGTRHVTDLLLRRHGLTNGSAPTVLPLSGLAAASALERGEVDMALLVAAPEAPAVQRLLRAPDVDLWHWRRAEAYARQIPVLARLDLPEGAVDLVANLPPRDLTLLSLKALLVTTSDIHPVLVDLLLDAAREVHGGSGLLHRAGDFPQPDATEYPMSTDAERYHKSGPSALQRFLPYWAVVWIQRLIYFGLPLLVVGLPLARALPALYRWAAASIGCTANSPTSSARPQPTRPGAHGRCSVWRRSSSGCTVCARRRLLPPKPTCCACTWTSCVVGGKGSGPQAQATQGRRSRRDRHDLLLGEEGLAGVSALAADAGVLVAAEGRAQLPHHRRVDPYDPRAQAFGHRRHGGQVVRPDIADQAEARVVGQGQRVVDIVEGHQRGEGAEDLVLGNAATVVGRDDGRGFGIEAG